MKDIILGNLFLVGSNIKSIEKCMMSTSFNAKGAKKVKADLEADAWHYATVTINFINPVRIHDEMDIPGIGRGYDEDLACGNEVSSITLEKRYARDLWGALDRDLLIQMYIVDGKRGRK